MVVGSSACETISSTYHRSGISKDTSNQYPRGHLKQPHQREGQEGCSARSLRCESGCTINRILPSKSLTPLMTMTWYKLQTYAIVVQILRDTWDENYLQTELNLAKKRCHPPVNGHRVLSRIVVWPQMNNRSTGNPPIIFTVIH